MKRLIWGVVALSNFAALFCVVNPWFEEWVRQGLVFLVVEMVALVVIGLPVFLSHLRKGASPGQALAASLDTVMHFMSGWM